MSAAGRRLRLAAPGRAKSLGTGIATNSAEDTCPSHETRWLLQFVVELPASPVQRGLPERVHREWAGRIRRDPYGRPRLSSYRPTPPGINLGGSGGPALMRTVLRWGWLGDSPPLCSASLSSLARSLPRALLPSPAGEEHARGYAAGLPLGGAGKRAACWQVWWESPAQLSSLDCYPQSPQTVR